MNTPYFPAWRRKLAAVGQRTGCCRQPSPVEIEAQCRAFLSPRALKAPDDGKRRRRRVFFLSRVFWCFLWQVLQPRTSCRAVVRQVQACCETERRTFDESTSAYCQARRRLPVGCLQQALADSAQTADRFSFQGIEGWTRPVKVVDASSVRLPDTPQNRKVYPYPSGQRPGCGFPVMQFCGLYSLSSGAILNTVSSPWSAHEVPLLRSLWLELQSGDILMGDRAFGAYTLLALLPLRGVDVVSRLHQGRRFRPRHGRRIGPGEWLATWRKPPQRPDYLTEEEWAAVTESITVRIIHIRIQEKGFRTQELWISTTLLDPIAYPAEQIARLYRRRWDMELCFRDLKTTMGMEELRCRTPAMVHKELLAFLIAHNFMRCLIAQAASAHQVCRTRISFKGAVDAARSFHQAMRLARSQRHARRLYRRLLEILARDLVPLRPGRYEPRAVKRRPKPYQRLTKARHHFREVPHRGKRIQKKPGRKPRLS
jgi:Transposase DDE domain